MSTVKFVARPYRASFFVYLVVHVLRCVLHLLDIRRMGPLSEFSHFSFQKFKCILYACIICLCYVI